MAFVNINAAIFGYILVEEDERRNHIRLERREIRDSTNPFEMPEEHFILNFRLNKQTVQSLIAKISPHANLGTSRSGIPFELKVLATLHFFSNGSYQNSVGNSLFNNMSQPSVSKAINEISRLIANNLLEETVKFPITRNEKNAIKQGFFNKWGFRGVIGAIDGTHVNIIAPPLTDEEHQPHLYINRKGKHSINVMLISDDECNILAINARYPGSVHDAAIWQMSDIRQHLRRQYEEGDRSSRLIGDSGYGNEPWLFTPYANPIDGTPQASFNVMHKSARNVIERTNGVLKSRFRCLLHHRVLHYHPATAAYIIYACAVLQNLALKGGLHLNDIEEDIGDDNVEVVNEGGLPHLYVHADGNAARNNYVQQNF